MAIDNVQAHIAIDNPNNTKQYTKLWALRIIQFEATQVRYIKRINLVH